jgi:hypothetical protein
VSLKRLNAIEQGTKFKEDWDRQLIALGATIGTIINFYSRNVDMTVEILVRIIAAVAKQAGRDLDPIQRALERAYEVTDPESDDLTPKKSPLAS